MIDECALGAGALKPDVEAFANAGWTLLQTGEYGCGEYTLAAVIGVLTHGIQRRPELKAWLPLVVNERLKRFLGAPVADQDPAALNELERALSAAAPFVASA